MPGRAAFGCKLGFGSPSPTNVANVTNISGLDGDIEVIDVTSHDSSGVYREKVASFIDAGQVSFDLNFDPQSTTHKATTGGLLYLRDQRTVETWTLEFPGAPTDKVTFDAFVKSAGIDLPFDDKMKMSVTLEVTGQPTWTYGA